MSENPAEARIRVAVAAVLPQFGSAAEILGVVVAPARPDDAEVGADVRVEVTVHHLGGSSAGHLLASATGWAELLVELAGWLQDDLADAWISDPFPPCPGHRHPMRPVVRDGHAWWVCPLGDPVRRFSETGRRPA